MNKLTELSVKVYQLQIEKGWCKPNEERDIEDLKVLILSEAYEAFEAYRKKNYAVLKDATLDVLKKDLEIRPHLKSTQDNFKGHIKDTFQDEIADVAIRALDLAGYLEVDFNGAIFKDIPTYSVKMNNVSFPKLLSYLTTYVSTYTHVPTLNGTLISWFELKKDHKPTGRSFILNILSWCKTIAKMHDFDLMQHIELKLAYNKTRPFRHGNKVV